jgi:DNA-binding response OmpR family regulator
MKPVRLLLVEDDAVSRGFLNLALGSMPATLVDLAFDAAQALTLARDHRHALWLLDANLPDASGEELLRELCALHRDVPALCLTAEVDPQRFENLRAAGFADVLNKPVAVVDLHRAVRAVLAANPPPIEDAASVWDDMQALQALGGNPAAVKAMRVLFATELPAQSEAILLAIATGDATKAQVELHKLKASCGFVGSLRLLDAVRALSAAPDDRGCIERFRAEVAAALAASADESAQSGS